MAWIEFLDNFELDHSKSRAATLTAMRPLLFAEKLLEGRRNLPHRIRLHAQADSVRDHLLIYA